MKENDIVEYVGCSIEQIRWGNNDDPRSILIVGKEYIVEQVDIHSQHTKVKLRHKSGWFNSVCFKVKYESLNTISHNKQKMDPSNIELENHSKMFEYEKISREIDQCDDIEFLRNMCRCYVKLHMKHQEVTAKLMKGI